MKFTAEQLDTNLLFFLILHTEELKEQWALEISIHTRIEYNKITTFGSSRAKVAYLIDHSIRRPVDIHDSLLIDS